MTHETWLTAPQVMERLEIKAQTLYAYASRGMVRSVPGPRGRARLYAAEDVELLKRRHDARSGHGAVAASALRFGEAVLETGVSQIGEHGLRYRGHDVLELLKRNMGFEQVSELLWGSNRSGESQRFVPLRVSTARAEVEGLANASPIARLTYWVARVGLLERFAFPAPDAVELEQARALIAWLAGRVHKVVRSPARGSPASVAEVLLRSYGHAAGQDAVRAVDAALVLCAEHELNASTFAARVAAGAGASLCAAWGSALGALSGAQHGGMCARVEALIDEAARLRRPADVVRARLLRAEVVPGFGHRSYPQGDPRGAALLRLCARTHSTAPDYVRLRAICGAMQRAGQPPPSLDAGLVALTSALGLPRGAASALFALGRMSGWVAHVLEQRTQGLIRPHARYVGPSHGAA